MTVKALFNPCGVSTTRNWAITALVIALFSAHTTLFAQEGRDALRICADPNSLPFSNQAQEGFENKIAELFGSTLNLPIEYTWFPQRRGFIRNTLRAVDPQTGREKCDLTMSVPVQFEQGLVTQPYYRSTYALVYRTDSPMGQIQSPDELSKLPAETLTQLKIGVFEQTPGATWLSRQGLYQQMVGYPTLNADPNQYPGQIIERNLHNKELDAAIVWGPIAGYFIAKNTDQNLAMLPLRSGDGIRFDFAIAMGVRFGDKDWRDQVKELIEQKQDEINRILRDYHVPLIDENGNLI